MQTSKCICLQIMHYGKCFEVLTLYHAGHCAKKKKKKVYEYYISNILMMDCQISILSLENICGIRMTFSLSNPDKKKKKKWYLENNIKPSILSSDLALPSVFPHNCSSAQYSTSPLESILPHVSAPSVNQVLQSAGYWQRKRAQALINLLIPICKGQLSDTIELTQGEENMK